jgi:hypothetical protein
MPTFERSVCRSTLLCSLLSAATLLLACDEHDHEDALPLDAAGSPSGADGGGADLLAAATTDTAIAPDTGAAAGDAIEGDGGTLASSRGRLLVADNDPENPRVVVLDLDNGAIVGRFPTLGTARAYSTDPGAGYAYAVQNVPGLVEIFASGITAAPGGGLIKQPPFPMDTRFQGPRPVHWVAHDHWVVSFNDGDGSFDYLLESTLGTNRVLTRRATTGIAHHGVAIITHGNVVASHAIPDPADATKTVRTGVTIRKLATPDTVVETVGGCPGLHGEAATDDIVAFGCADGLILGERTDGKLSFRKLAHPEAKAIGTLRAKGGLPRLVGNLRDAVKGYDVGVVLVAYAEATPTWTPVDTGARNLGFLFEATGTRLLVLGGDGALRLYDALSGAAIGTPLPVTDAYTTGALPALAVGAGVAFVLDPRSGKVIEAELAGWRLGRTFAVGGQPISAAAFGVAPAAGPR